MANLLPSRIGLIGLGAMGLPMARNLAEKLPKESQIFVYDVMQESVEQLASEYEEPRITACENAAAATAKSVRALEYPSMVVRAC